MGSLKILIFNWRDPKHPDAGGAEKATYEVARRWVNCGHEIHWVCGGFRSGPSSDEIDGIRIARIGGKYSVYALSPLHYFINLKRSCDVVIDEINTVPFFSVFFVDVPKVALIHQLAADVLFEELPRFQAEFWNLMEPRVLRMYRGVPIITSESTRDDLLRIGMPKSNVHTINYGVDKKVYRPGREKETTPLIVYLGRIRRFKGVHYLVQAMEQIVESVPGTRASIVGTGDPEYESELRELAESLGLSDSIDFCEFGFGSSLRQKVELLQKAWVLVFPSIREGFGLTIVEANACGTPAVATDVPGLRNTVRNHETGILVPAKDVDALAGAVIELLRDDQLREQLSRNAVQWSENFDWDKTADRMLTVLRKAVNSPGSISPS